MTKPDNQLGGLPIDPEKRRRPPSVKPSRQRKSTASQLQATGQTVSRAGSAITRFVFGILALVVIAVVISNGCAGSESVGDKIASCRQFAIEGRDDLLEVCRQELRELQAAK